MPRLATCHHCHILVRIPDVVKGTPYKPAVLRWTTGEEFVYKDDKGLPVMVPAYDPVLEDFVTKHSHHYTDAEAVAGVVQVHSVDQKTWDAIDVVTELKTAIQRETGKWYAEKDEYREAATKCYNDHGNPDASLGCRDYMDDSKRIGPAKYTTEDGQEVNVPNKYRQYLCYLCPFQQAYVNVELRRRKGYYKK